jgi:hypothetical protein
LSVDERAEITLLTDNTGSEKTVFVIQNAPAWIDLEVGRVAHQWEKNGYEEGHALSYAWVSMCLLEIRNMNTVGDTVKPPRSEQFTVRTGDKASRIPLEWLVKQFGKRYRMLDELSSAIYVFNHLTESQRKNWTWQDGSAKPAEAATCPANAQAANTSPVTPESGVSDASSDSKPQKPSEGGLTTEAP